MNCVRLKNPSPAVLASVNVLASGYERTCMSDTCACASHDSGYQYIDVSEKDAEFCIQRPGTPSSHGDTITKVEKTLFEAARQKRLREQARLEALDRFETARIMVKERYPQHHQTVWAMRVPFALEKPVADAVHEMLKRRKDWVQLIDDAAVGRYRKNNFPHLSGPRFNTVLAIADAIFTKK
jgi:hypothetical protein